MNKLSSLFVLSAVALGLVGAGCGESTGPKGPDGGVWKTTDKGQTWVLKKALVQGPKVTGAVASMQILDITFDPQDHNVIYLSTAQNGVVYSVDGGESWQQPLTELNSGRVGSVALDPKNKCTVYAVSSNRVYKTETCGRDWRQAGGMDGRADVEYTQIVTDWYNPTILFVGTSKGDIMRSLDGGASWQVLKRVEDTSITSIALDPRDSRQIWVGTYGDGIYKSADGGNTWIQIRKEFGDEFREARRVTQIVLDPVTPNVAYVISKYGVIQTTDGGSTWVAVNLPSPPGTVRVQSLAVDPKNNQMLAYTGVGVLQFSPDGGKSWSAHKMPTTQAGSVLVIDPIDSNIMYLGTNAPPAKN